MDTTTSPTSPPASTGRVAVPEVAELLQLRRRPAAVAAAAVVLLALVLTLVAPDAIPANAVVGLVVGLLAVVAAVVLAVLIDGRDPILRGPRHLRRDGHAVLGRMAGPDVGLHGGEVLEALERRLESVDRLRIVLTGTGADPSELAIALGRGAAAKGHTSLVIDLRAASAPGVAEVGAGDVRLGEAARLADDRPYAWISAGSDRTAGAEAAVGVAQRPPRDLRLLLIVAPEVATQVPSLLETCDRTVVLVPADTEQRSMVTARLDALRRAGARPEAIVVGGVAMAPAVEASDAAAGAVADETDTAARSPFTEQHTASTPIAPFAPAELPTRPAATPPDHADADDTADERDEAVSVVEKDAGAPAAAAPAPLPPPPAPHAPVVDVTDAATTDAATTDAEVQTSDAPPARDDSTPPRPTAFVAPPAPPRVREDAAPRVRDDWDLRSVRPMSAASTADVEVGGMAAADPLTTTAALEGLLGAAGRSDEG